MINRTLAYPRSSSMVRRLHRRGAVLGDCMGRGCTYSVCSYQHPEGRHFPDPDIPERLRGLTFASYLASYFTHPQLDATESEKLALRSLVSLELYLSQPYTRCPTSENIPPTKLLTKVDLIPGTGSRMLFGVTPNRRIYMQRFCKPCFGMTETSLCMLLH